MFDTEINIGIVLFQNGSTINGVKTQPSTAYGFEQQQNIFNRAFGPLKLSGFTLAPSGSSTGSLVIGSGTAYAPGSNYTVDPNNPSYAIDPGTNTSKIYRYYQTGSSWVYLTNAGAGFGAIDPQNYSNNGTLTNVGAGNWSIQRVFWFPNSVAKAIIVYYGNNIYTTEADAIANLNIESFVEAPNTAANAVYVGAIVINGTGVFTSANDFTLLPGGLFRQVGGSGGGGSVVTQTLAGLSDVSISGPTNLQPLAYSTTAGKWINTSTISASIAGNASTATSASFATTASFAVSSSYALSSSNALTSSYAFFAVSSSYAATASRADNAISASFAATASFIANVVYTTGSQSISGLKTFTDKTTFNNHVVLDGTGSNNYTLAFKQPSSTLSFLSGDYTEIGAFGNSQLVFNFGQLPSDYKRFTFNVGNLSLNTPRTFQFPDKTGTLLINDITTGSVATASLALTSSYAINTVSASYAATASIATSASFALTAVSASFAVNATTASFAVNATTASYALNAVSASFASTASFVLNAISASFAISSSQAVSSSYAISASSSILASTASYVLQAVSASFATSASYALSSSFSISSSVAVSSSYALSSSNSISSSYALSASFAVSSNQAATASYVLNAVSASFAATASSADNFLVRQNVTASNALITGTLTAQTLVVQTVTSSIVYSSGSNIFGNSLTDRQILTGSVSITGSLTVNGPSTFNGVVTANNLTGSLFGTASYAIQALSASYAATGGLSVSSSYALSSSYAVNASSGSNFVITNSYRFDATLNDYATVISSISGTNNLFTQPTGSFTAGFYKYTVTNSTNARTGEVMAVWNAGNIEFTDFSTVDLGNTLVVSASVTIVSAEAQLNIITNTSGWSIKALATYM